MSPDEYAGNPRRHAVALNALTRALSVVGRSVSLSERKLATTVVLNALDADAPQSGQMWDPSSPQWAVIRAAIDWRKAVDDLDADKAVTENALIAAVDALDAEAGAR